MENNLLNFKIFFDDRPFNCAAEPVFIRKASIKSFSYTIGDNLVADIDLKILNLPDFCTKSTTYSVLSSKIKEEYQNKISINITNDKLLFFSQDLSLEG